jgi:hypothetical protein
MPAPRRQQCPSNASAMTATMLKRCWQQCQCYNNASTATTVGRHAPHQRNACQQDVGDDASGDFSKDGEFVKDNDFSTNSDLAGDGSLAKEGNFNAVGDFAEGRQQFPSNVGKGASSTTAPEFLQRKDVLRAVRTIPRRLIGMPASGMLEMTPVATLPRKAILSRTTTSAQKDDLAEDGSVTE